MRLRVLLEPHHGVTYGQILALATAAEEGGFDAFFRSDHYLGIEADDTTYEPTDSWTTLAGLALQTERVRLGTLVNASTFRLPGQLAVEVATVDQMSGGRAELGIGAAWYEREHQYFGIPFPPLGERFDRLEEQLAILTGIWDTKPGERFSFDGKFYQVQDCASIPRWAARPKIIIGGAGAKRTPTLAARYADEFNGALGMDVRERYANFRRICQDVVGRDPAEVRLSATLPVCIGTDAADLERRKEKLGEPGARLLAAGVTGTAGDVIAAIENLAAQGADTVYFHLYGRDDVDHIRLLGSEVVSRFLSSRGLLRGLCNPGCPHPYPYGPVPHVSRTSPSTYASALAPMGSEVSSKFQLVQRHNAPAAKLVRPDRCRGVMTQAALGMWETSGRAPGACVRALKSFMNSVL